MALTVGPVWPVSLPLSLAKQSKRSYLVVDGDVNCTNMNCNGLVLMRGARISGSLDAVDARHVEALWN